MQAQPYRGGKGRHPGMALTAMLRGRSATGMNSADLTRATQRLVRAGKQRSGRPARPVRPKRPAR